MQFIDVRVIQGHALCKLVGLITTDGSDNDVNLTTAVWDASVDDPNNDTLIITGVVVGVILLMGVIGAIVVIVIKRR